MIGGQLSGSVQQQGADAGRIATPEGTAEAINGPVAASATMANAHKYGFGQMATAQSVDRMTATGSTLGSVDHLGGGDVHHAVDRMAGAGVTQRAEDVGRAEGKGGPGHSEYMGRQQGQQSFGAALQDTRMAQALGISSGAWVQAKRRHLDRMACNGKCLGLVPISQKLLR
jgi:hypothetical protein